MGHLSRRTIDQLTSELRDREEEKWETYFNFAAKGEKMLTERVLETF